jgi:hypothetical protein
MLIVFGGMLFILDLSSTIVVLLTSSALSAIDVMCIIQFTAMYQYPDDAQNMV